MEIQKGFSMWAKNVRYQISLAIIASHNICFLGWMEQTILTGSALNIIKINGCCHSLAQKNFDHHCDVELLQYRILGKGVKGNYKFVSFSMIKTI